MNRNMVSFTRCGYEVPVLPLSSYALSPTMMPLLETFLKLLLWNSFQCHRHGVFSIWLQYPEIIVLSRQTLFLEKAMCHVSSPVIIFDRRVVCQLTRKFGTHQRAAVFVH
jgi:hypothetical protein